jgi:hypothetical protein
LASAVACFVLRTGLGAIWPPSRAREVSSPEGVRRGSSPVPARLVAVRAARGRARVRGRQGHARPAQDDHSRHHLLVAMDIATHAARKLARRSSRRQFFKLLGAGSLGAGLFLTPDRRFARGDHRLRRLRRRPVQSVLLACRPLQRRDERRVSVQELRGWRRLSRRLQLRRRVVLLPHERGACRLPLPLLGVQLPGRARETRPATASPTSPCRARRGSTRAISNARVRRWTRRSPA